MTAGSFAAQQVVTAGSFAAQQVPTAAVAALLVAWTAGARAQLPSRTAVARTVEGVTVVVVPLGRGAATAGRAAARDGDATPPIVAYTIPASALLLGAAVPALFLLAGGRPARPAGWAARCSAFRVAPLRPRASHAALRGPPPCGVPGGSLPALVGGAPRFDIAAFPAVADRIGKRSALGPGNDQRRVPDRSVDRLRSLRGKHVPAHSAGTLLAMLSALYTVHRREHAASNTAANQRVDRRTRRGGSTLF